MDEEWDTDNFKIKEPVTAAANKWEGEDEDDDVKDSWDLEDEEEEKKDVEKIETKSKKKTVGEKIAEREKLKEQELEQKQIENEEMTLEERLQRQKESDLQMALDTTFQLNNTSEAATGLNSIDAMHPTNKNEFTQLAEALNKKLTPYMKNADFLAFAEEHIRNLCVSLNSTDIRKLKMTIDNMYLEKQRVEREKTKKPTKGKVKARLRVEENNMDEYKGGSYVDVGDYNEYDDFM